MAGRLPQPQQRFQHVHLRSWPCPAVCTRAQQGVAIVRAQLVVVLALRTFQFAVDGLLGLRRQLARHLLFGAPQDEGPQRVRQQLPRFLAGIARQSAGHLEHSGLAQHARIEEFEQAPQFAQVVLHRRAAERQTMRAAQQAHRFGGSRGGVLDGLRFVQHHVIELDLGQLRGIAQQRAVGGQHQVVLRESASVSRAVPVCSSTRSCGVKRAASSRQLNISDFGATTSEGP